MLTCKEFLSDLNEFLDETLGADLRTKLQDHVNQCPNCWVVFDTTKKTLQVYKGLEPQAVPCDIKERLMAALQKKMASQAH